MTMARPASYGFGRTTIFDSAGGADSWFSRQICDALVMGSTRRIMEPAPRASSMLFAMRAAAQNPTPSTVPRPRKYWSLTCTSPLRVLPNPIRTFTSDVGALGGKYVKLPETSSPLAYSAPPIKILGAEDGLAASAPLSNDTL